MSELSDQLAKAQQEFEAQQAQLQENFAKKKAELLMKVETELADALGKAFKVYSIIPKENRATIYSGVSSILDALGLQPVKVKGKAAKTRGKATDDEIVTFLEIAHSQADVARQFGFSDAGAGLRLKKMAKDGKVTKTADKKRKGSFVWRAA